MTVLKCLAKLTALSSLTISFQLPVKPLYHRCVQACSGQNAQGKCICTPPPTHTHTHLCTDSLSFTPTHTHYHCQLSKLQKASGRMYWTQASPGLLCFTLLSPNTICLCHCKVTKASIPKCSSEVGTCLQTAS